VYTNKPSANKIKLTPFAAVTVENIHTDVVTQAHDWMTTSYIR